MIPWWTLTEVCPFIKLCQTHNSCRKCDSVQCGVVTHNMCSTQLSFLWKLCVSGNFFTGVIVIFISVFIKGWILQAKLLDLWINTYLQTLFWAKYKQFKILLITHEWGVSLTFSRIKMWVAVMLTVAEYHKITIVW